MTARAFVQHELGGPSHAASPQTCFFLLGRRVLQSEKTRRREVENPAVNALGVYGVKGGTTGCWLERLFVARWMTGPSDPEWLQALHAESAEDARKAKPSVPYLRADLSGSFVFASVREWRCREKRRRPACWEIQMS